MLYLPNSESIFLQPLKVTCRVFDEKSKPLSGVYRSRQYSHPQNQKRQKVMLSRPAEAGNGSLGLRNSYATKELYESYSFFIDLEHFV